MTAPSPPGTPLASHAVNVARAATARDRLHARILHSQAEANAACERPGWVTVHPSKTTTKKETTTMAAKPTNYFTTSAGVESVTRTNRRFIVADSATAELHLRTDDKAKASEVALARAELEVIDLQKDGRTSKPRTPRVTEPEQGYVRLAGAPRVARRHLPGAEGGTRCHPEATVEPAEGGDTSALCKTCQKLAAK